MYCQIIGLVVDSEACEAWTPRTMTETMLGDADPATKPTRLVLQLQEFLVFIIPRASASGLTEGCASFRHPRTLGCNVSMSHSRQTL